MPPKRARAPTQTGSEHSNDSEDESVADTAEIERTKILAVSQLHLSLLKKLFAEAIDEERIVAYTIRRLKGLIASIDHHSKGYDVAHASYCSQTPGVSNEEYSNIQLDKIQIVADLEDRIAALENEQGIGVGAVAPSQGTTQQIIRIEPTKEPKIGTFNGEFADWPIFRALFISQVHNKEFDDFSKLSYLENACIGDAKEALGTWPPVGESYAAAWEAINRKFSDDYRIVQSMISKVVEFPEPEIETYALLSRAVDRMNHGIRRVRATITGEPREDQLWINMLLRSLPISTSEAWEAYRNTHYYLQTPNLDAFRKFLEIRVGGRKDQTPIGQSNQSTSHGNTTSHSNKRRHEQSGNNNQPSFSKRYEFNNNRNSTGPTACTMAGCDRIHYLGQCEVFRKFTLPERNDYVIKNHLCRCCLAPGHRAIACPRNTCVKCPDSRFKHHFRLCDKSFDTKLYSNANNNGSKEPAKP